MRNTSNWLIPMLPFELKLPAIEEVERRLVIDRRIAIDLRKGTVVVHEGPYCRKGQRNGKFGIEDLTNLGVRFRAAVQRNASLVFEVENSVVQFGIAHLPGSICSKDELAVAFDSWSKSACKPYKSLSWNDWMDVKHEVYLTAADKLDHDRLLIESPPQYLNRMARTICIAAWRKKKKVPMTTLPPDLASALPSREVLEDVLEIREEMAALRCLDPDGWKNMQLLRWELVKIDPSGAILRLAQLLQQHSKSLATFFDAYVRLGDKTKVAAELNITESTIKTYLYRIRLFLREQEEGEAA